MSVATPTALYSQNSSQSGTTVAGAFPQLTTQGGGTQNLDLIQIITKSGGQVLAVVDYQGTVVGTPGFTLSSVSVSGTTTTYNGTITSGGSNALIGRKADITGFANGSNNGSFLITSSTSTSFTVVTVGQVNETKAANAIIYTKGTRVGRFATNVSSLTASLATIFGDTFANPSQLDILQVINSGGFIHYNLNYLGVAAGS